MKTRISEKQKMIDELMEGNNFAYPNSIREKLNRKSTEVIRFYFSLYYKARHCSKEHTIDCIIRIG